MKKQSVKLKAMKAAFPYTIPIMAGFGFLGMGYGILMNVNGFSFWYPLLMCITVFGGSMQYVAVTLLTSTFAPLQTLAVALMIQARHIFYSISMLEKFKGTGAKKLYLIFGMCDETFSINCTAEPPEDVDRGWFMFFVTLFDHLYWIIASTLGGILGSFIPFDTQGLEFVMTAMFVVIFLDQWLKEKGHISSIVGVFASLACRLIFGPESFLIPTMICILAMLTFLRKPIERQVTSE